MLRPAIALALFAVAAPARAATKYDVIIFAGGTAPDDPLPALERARGGGAFTLAKGFPKVIESAKVKGLKPGFHVAVLGFCPAGDRRAVLARDLMRLDFPGTYLRTVEGPFDGQCPKIALPPAREPKELPLMEESPFAPGSTVKWRLFRREFPDLKSGEQFHGTQVLARLVQEGRLVAEAPFNGRARAGDEDQGDYGFSEEWKAPTVVAAGERSYLIVVMGTYGGDTGSLAYELWGHGCGTVRKVLALGSFFDPCCGPGHTVDVAWVKQGKLRVDVRSQSIEEVGPTYYGWAPESCSLDVVGEPSPDEPPAGDAE
jgi:hypothetical protein